MGNAFSNDNDIDNPGVGEVSDSLMHVAMSRRQWLKAASIVPLFSVAPGCVSTALSPDSGTIGFRSIPATTADAIVVPDGYSATVLYRWGDPTGIATGMPAFRDDAGNTAAEQALQSGMHHDGMEYFPLPAGSSGSVSALLAINHEYTDDGLLHTDGMKTWTAEKVLKSQNAHGVSVIEIRGSREGWNVVKPSSYARRVTARTPMKLSGPAAGSAALRTASDPTGTTVLGTINNCAGGLTPWGTYLTCEENWNNYFVNPGTITADQRRYGINATGAGYRWHEHDERFDARRHPNESNRFGWVVEIDPYDPQSTPVKRTALGRIKHEGAMLAISRDRRVVFYMGDDQQFEYIYKFVSRDAWEQGNRSRNRDLLDNGTLYVARFNQDGSGDWLALAHGQNGLTKEAGFADQADVLVRTRQAADRAGATKMDRPEWLAVHPVDGSVYCTLTNNSARGGPGQVVPDAANPRATNTFGHIIRWSEDSGDAAAARFRWNIFVLAGDRTLSDAAKQGNIKGDTFGSPDGLWFDRGGRLWIQTDVSTSTLNRGDYAAVGNNQMLCADVKTGEIRRFLTGPRGCEVTGVVTTPDGRTMFVNIQHPGEPASERSNPDQTLAVSSWPDGKGAGRPRAATIVIRKNDGGVVGT
jgi:secreted PhoX family phosphatase